MVDKKTLASSRATSYAVLISKWENSLNYGVIEKRCRYVSLRYKASTNENFICNES